MPRLAANLSFLFPELPFLDRFAAAADAGFAGVEFLFPYDFAPGLVRARAEAAGVAVALFNAYAGNWAMGERGLACLPRRELEFRSSIDQALDYAGELGCPTLHVMAGNPVAGEPVAEALARYVDNLHFAVERVASAGRNAVIEPLNRIDMPGYLLNSTTAAAAIIEQIGHPHLGLQFDFYHVQRMEGELTRSFQTLMPRILHVQIAGVPDRHEPSPSEIDPAYLLRLIDALGYAGWVGCEYHPRDGTRNGLGWADAFIST